MLEASEDQVQSLINEATQATVIAKMPDADWDEAPPLTASLAPARSYLSPRQDSTTFLFCQGIVQEVLSAEVPTSQARRLHWAIGAALEASYAGSAPVHAAELARHYALSGDKPAALQWSLLAGENAVRQQTHREAIGHFRLVLRLLEAGIVGAGMDRRGGSGVGTLAEPCLGDRYAREGDLCCACPFTWAASSLDWRELVQAG